MANERNAGRKPKYANKCKQVGFNLPLDVIDEVKEKVREIVRTKAKLYSEPVVEEKQNGLSRTATTKNMQVKPFSGIPTSAYEPPTPVKRIKDLFEKAEFPCGCSIENNLLKRGKGKCKLTKEQHLKS